MLKNSDLKCPPPIHDNQNEISKIQQITVLAAVFLLIVHVSNLDEVEVSVFSAMVAQLWLCLSASPSLLTRNQNIF